MKTSQVVAGALIDFVQSMKDGNVIDRLIAPQVFLALHDFAADHGLDLDAADVAGWQKELQSHSIPPRMPGQVVRDL